MKRYKRLEERDMAREDSVRKKQLMIQMQDTSQQLGPGSPVWGRRPKRHLATVQITDKVESEDEESEPDLGPLRSLEQIHQMEDTFQSFESYATPTGAAKGSFGAGSTTDAEDLTDEGVELILDASRHVARGIVERTRGARVVLLDEMSESMDVPNNVSTVLEVLGKRTRDLEAQQRQILKRHL
ncbi:Polycystin-2 [Durusdinium trenchii]|uniref:Polycystin-2 n=1 Tax=Durusdinium trenchii TaxID=1381693 RepID=A0ABP0L2S7_9DINO